MIKIYYYFCVTEMYLFSFHFQQVFNKFSQNDVMNHFCVLYLKNN